EAGGAPFAAETGEVFDTDTNSVPEGPRLQGVGAPAAPTWARSRRVEAPRRFRYNSAGSPRRSPDHPRPDHGGTLHARPAPRLAAAGSRPRLVRGRGRRPAAEGRPGLEGGAGRTGPRDPLPDRRRRGARRDGLPRPGSDGHARPADRADRLG